MYSVYANLRRTTTIQTTSLNIHRSGFKVKLQGTPDAITDAGAEKLVAAQPTDPNGRMDTKITGKVETESHDQSLTFAYPLKQELLAIVRKQDVVAPRNATEAEEAAYKAKEEAAAAKATAKANGKAKAKAKDVPDAEEVVIDRGTDTAALNGTTEHAAK